MKNIILIIGAIVCSCSGLQSVYPTEVSIDSEFTAEERAVIIDAINTFNAQIEGNPIRAVSVKNYYTESAYIFSLDIRKRRSFIGSKTTVGTSDKNGDIELFVESVKEFATATEISYCENYSAHTFYLALLKHFTMHELGHGLTLERTTHMRHPIGEGIMATRNEYAYVCEPGAVRFTDVDCEFFRKNTTFRCR
jgi:hypothetical protein